MPETLQPPTAVVYAPYIEYRGRLLWHHLTDAHDYATDWASRRGWRTRVTPKRVPGHDHLLWQVRFAKDRSK